MKIKRLNKNIIHVDAVPEHQFWNRKGQKLIILPDTMTSEIMGGTVLTGPITDDPETDQQLQPGTEILFMGMSRSMVQLMVPADGQALYDPGEYFVSTRAILAIVE